MYTALPEMSSEEVIEWERRRQVGLSRIDRGRGGHPQAQHHEQQECEKEDGARLAKEPDALDERERLRRERSGKENGVGQGVRQQRPPRRRALLVGICYGQQEASSEYTKLKGPHRDVNKFRKLLMDIYHYRKEDIVVMIDRQSVVDPSHNTPSHRVPTKENLTREIQNLVKGAQPGDRFVFVFSGHSDQQEQSLADNDQPEEDNRDEVIITSDNEKIVDNDLHRWLVEPLPAGSGLTAIIDSCHSGTMLDLPHRLCNGIYVPWLSRSMRRTGIMQNSTDPDFPSISSVFERQLDTGSYDQSEGPLRLDTHGLPSQPPIQTRSPLATAQEMLFGDALMSSPVCLSPDKIKYCSGYCSHDDRWKESKADVISLSACNDLQRAWEDDHGHSMIWILCDYLTKHENASYHEVMYHVNHKLYQTAVRLHKWSQEQKRLAKGPVDGEMATFQTPELCSLVKLNMKDKIQF